VYDCRKQIREIEYGKTGNDQFSNNVTLIAGFDSEPILFCFLTILKTEIPRVEAG
jgi:hypothetical protein